jgi:hypothetical protein
MNEIIYHPNRDDYNLTLVNQIEEKLKELNELNEKLKESVEKVLS